MLIVIKSDNKEEAEHESVRIKRIVLDLHGRGGSRILSE